MSLPSWFYRRRPRPVKVNLLETDESRARKRAEADWDAVREHAAEHARIRAENHIGARYYAAFHANRGKAAS